mmetsp:Transcript_136079/g.307744  ORF Transcript_136079/g.307744 Transcript_136079/m.307744 type:complete len:255 (-) Transcript_136079:74-838(-)
MQVPPFGGMVPMFPGGPFPGQGPPPYYHPPGLGQAPVLGQASIDLMEEIKKRCRATLQAHGWAESSSNGSNQESDQLSRADMIANLRKRLSGEVTGSSPEPAAKTARTIATPPKVQSEWMMPGHGPPPMGGPPPMVASPPAGPRIPPPMYQPPGGELDSMKAQMLARLSALGGSSNGRMPSPGWDRSGSMGSMPAMPSPPRADVWQQARPTISSSALSSRAQSLSTRRASVAQVASKPTAPLEGDALNAALLGL